MLAVLALINWFPRKLPAITSKPNTASKQKPQKKKINKKEKTKPVVPTDCGIANLGKKKLVRTNQPEQHHISLQTTGYGPGLLQTWISNTNKKKRINKKVTQSFALRQFTAGRGNPPSPNKIKLNWLFFLLSRAYCVQEHKDKNNYNITKK